MVISSTTTTTPEWPHQIEESGGLIANRKGNMEKIGNQDHQQALKCPRCDSSNTKFCYYNNYSLSQPRHFCKACKRYWTRGGTLRSVPVGGGYRKNKRVVIKKPSSNNDTSSSQLTSTKPNIQSHQLQMNPLFYGLPDTSSSFMSHLSFSPSLTGSYDHQSQLGHMGLNYDHETYGTRYVNDSTTTEAQDLINSSSSLLSSRFSLFGSPSSSLNMESSLDQQHKFMLNSTPCDPRESRSSISYIQGLLPYDLQMGGMNSDDMRMERNKEMKREEGNKVMEWNLPYQNAVGSNDSTMYWNSNMSVGVWPELNNYGSSVTSLI